MALGIVLYFSSPLEPAPPTPWILIAAASIGWFLCRSDPVHSILQLALLSVVIGFVLIDWRVDAIDSPRLQTPAYNVRISGQLTDVELRPSGYRLLLTDLTSPLWIIDPRSGVYPRLSRYQFSPSAYWLSSLRQGQPLAPRPARHPNRTL